MTLLWGAVTTVIVICVYVYLRVDQASTATGLITGAAGLRAMRVGPLEQSDGPAGLVASRPPTLRRLRGHHR